MPVFHDPDALELAQRYKLLVGAVVPRPIAFVSTLDPRGRANLAPYSFFNAVGSHPMLLMFCPANNLDGSEKDSLRNASPAPVGLGQFVVNVASESYEKQVALAAEALAHGESEFELTGLTPASSEKVRPPRVAESPIAFECETVEVRRYAPSEPAGANMVVGKVVGIHTHEDLLNDRFHVDPETLRAIGRMGGLDYARTRERFEMLPGRKALEA